jgi:serine/threonine-protein kinase
VREAEAAARLPNTPTSCRSTRSASDGRPYLALEFVAGGNLAQRLGGTPLPARDAARLVRTLAGAVQAALTRA